jgi:xanthine/CO dehydrogenase XdhC/CoxF family maturation factor
MLNRDEDILQAAENWQKAGHGVALATVVETWGSAPRPAGSSLVINDDGTFLGSVSGGCVEGAVVTEALAILAGEAEPRIVTFGYSDDEAFAVGLTCGGTIRLFIEPLDW